MTLATPLPGVIGRPVQRRADVGVAKAVQQILTREHRLEQPHVPGAGRVETGMAPPRHHHRLGQFLHLTIRRRRVVDQAEYATDLIFTSREALAGLYPRLLDHAAVHFSAKDILGFLGRRFHPRFDGEVLTDCQKGRHPGSRIKHRVKNNWLKMYDKFGLVLRIETVINSPREFRVRRLRTRDGRRQMVWCPMNKGVINLYRYREVALASNRRYLDALAVVDDPAPAYRQVADLTEPVVVSGRSHAGFNPASRGDVSLFQAVLQGEDLLRGFRNADIRAALHGPTEDADERHRQSHAVGRMLKRLHVRGLIAKVPHSHRWHVSGKGHQVLGAVVRLYHEGIPAAVRRAA